jgi:hypothetical protein
MRKRAITWALWTGVGACVICCANTARAYDVTIENDYSFPGRSEFDYGLQVADVEFSDEQPGVGDAVTITAHIHNYAGCRVNGAHGWFSSDGRSCWGEWDFDYPGSGTVDVCYRCFDDVDVHWRVELDGMELASPVVPGVGDADHWKIVTVHDVPITAGSHTVFLGTYQMDYQPDYRVDWVRVGSVHIEAETYDRMGGNDPDSDKRGLDIRPMAAYPPQQSNLTIQLWDGEPGSGGTLICEDFVGPTNTVVDRYHVYPGTTFEAHYIPNGGQADLVCDWTPLEGGTRQIYVVVDPYEVLDEIDELNNVAHRSIVVGDSTPPDVSCSVGTDVLWAPNHHLVDVGLTTIVSDDCDPNGAAESLVIEVWSDETEVPETGDGTGRHAPDAKDIDTGLRLRKERRGTEDGRVYLIIARAEDASGNVGFGYCTVVVPHDQSQEGLDEVAIQAQAALATVEGTPGTTIAEKVAALVSEGWSQHGVSEELGPHQ